MAKDWYKTEKRVAGKPFSMPNRNPPMIAIWKKVKTSLWMGDRSETVSWWIWRRL